VKVKMRWEVKLGAPRRLWAPNRRGASPEIPKLISGDPQRRLRAHIRRCAYPNFTSLFHFSNKVTMTSVKWSKPTSWETSPRRLICPNRRGVSASF